MENKPQSLMHGSFVCIIAAICILVSIWTTLYISLVPSSYRSYYVYKRRWCTGNRTQWLLPTWSTEKWIFEHTGNNNFVPNSVSNSPTNSGNCLLNIPVFTWLSVIHQYLFFIVSDSSSFVRAPFGHGHVSFSLAYNRSVLGSWMCIINVRS